MLDEKKVIKIIGKNKKELELKADFKAFKSLQKITGNAFEAIDDFAKDIDKRLELLPSFIKAMSNTELTLEEIEEEFLSLNYTNMLQITTIIFTILNFEMKNEVKTEESTEEVEQIEKN